MDDNKLQAKDFITVGIFAAILMVIEFAFGILSASSLRYASFSAY